MGRRGLNRCDGKSVILCKTMPRSESASRKPHHGILQGAPATHSDWLGQPLALDVLEYLATQARPHCCSFFVSSSPLPLPSRPNPHRLVSGLFDNRPLAIEGSCSHRCIASPDDFHVVYHFVISRERDAQKVV